MKIILSDEEIGHCSRTVVEVFNTVMDENFTVDGEKNTPFERRARQLGSAFQVVFSIEYGKYLDAMKAKNNSEADKILSEIFDVSTWIMAMMIRLIAQENMEAAQSAMLGIMLDVQDGISGNGPAARAVPNDPPAAPGHAN